MPTKNQIEVAELSSGEIAEKIHSHEKASAAALQSKTDAASRADRKIFEAADQEYNHHRREIEWLEPQKAAAERREAEMRKAAEKAIELNKLRARNTYRSNMREISSRIQGQLEGIVDDIALLKGIAKTFVEEGGSPGVNSVLSRRNAGNPLIAAIWSAGLADHLQTERVSPAKWESMTNAIDRCIGPDEEPL